MQMDAFDRLNNINYRGSWLSCRAQLREMLKQEPLSDQPKQRGSIVNIASQLGIVARPGAGKTVAAPLGYHDLRLHHTYSCVLRF